MMGTKIRSFAPLPRDVSLEELVPKDHFYRRLEVELDLSFVRELVRPLYAGGGRPSVDPVVFFKLQLVMFFEDLRSERQLMRVVADRLSLRWYLGADFTTHAGPSWDAVADGAALQERGLALVRDGGAFVGVQPNAEPATERGISAVAVVTHPDGPRLGDLLTRTASGELPARVHAVVPLGRVADAHRAVAKGGVRGRFVLKP